MTASNSGGSSTATVTITVNDIAPSSIVYSGNPFTLTKDSAMTTATQGQRWSGHLVVDFPSLPSGLSFNTSTGAISGTPTTITSSTTYTVTASNTGGSATTTVTIVVNDAPPTGSPQRQSVYVDEGHDHDLGHTVRRWRNRRELVRFPVAANRPYL